MIGYLRGTLLSKKPPRIVLDVSGVGYEVDVPMTTLYDLPEVGTPLALYTHLLIREDAHQLYGFLLERDRDLFRELIKVNGVGAKTALSILSSLNSANLIAAITRNELAVLIKIPGIGRKTAERLILEMRDRLSKADTSLVLTAVAEPKQDAISALIALGYKAQEAEKAIKKHAEEGLSSEMLIKLALKEMIH